MLRSTLTIFVVAWLVAGGAGEPQGGPRARPEWPQQPQLGQGQQVPQPGGGPGGSQGGGQGGGQGGTQGGGQGGGQGSGQGGGQGGSQGGGQSTSQGGSQGSSQGPIACTTPLNREGLCIPLQTCRPLLALLHSSRGKPRGLPDTEVTLLLRMSHCGFQGNTVMVCCPPDDGKVSESRTKPDSSTAPSLEFEQQPGPTPSDINPLGALYPELPEGPVGGPQEGPEGGLPGWPEHPHVRDPMENLALLPTELCGLRATPTHAPGQVPANTSAPMQYPWMARLGYRLGDSVEYLCSGSLISERYVLTAAHCVRALNGPVTVRLGDRDANSDPDCDDSLCAPSAVDVEVEEAVIQDGSQDRLNDIALLRLGRPVPFTDAVSPICLPVPVLNRPEEDQTGRAMVVASWGNTSPNRRQNAPSRWLLHFRANVIRGNVCKDAYADVDDVRFSSETHFCVSSGCHGDSGSPLMLAGEEQALQRVVLQGVLSFGLPDCALRSAPVVFARVSRALPWILRNLKPNPFVPKDKTSGSSQMDPRAAAVPVRIPTRSRARVPAVSHRGNEDQWQ